MTKLDHPKEKTQNMDKSDLAVTTDKSKVQAHKDKIAVETKKGDLPKDETGGRKEGLDPTRYNDWEMKGRCIDF